MALQPGYLGQELPALGLLQLHRGPGAQDAGGPLPVDRRAGAGLSRQYQVRLRRGHTRRLVCQRDAVPACRDADTSSGSACLKIHIFSKLMGTHGAALAGLSDSMCVHLLAHEREAQPRRGLRSEGQDDRQRVIIQPCQYAARACLLAEGAQTWRLRECTRVGGRRQDRRRQAKALKAPPPGAACGAHLGRLRRGGLPRRARLQDVRQALRGAGVEPCRWLRGPVINILSRPLGRLRPPPQFLIHVQQGGHGGRWEKKLITDCSGA